MYGKKCNSILVRKVLQNVIARVVLIWVFLLEWSSIVGLCQENIGKPAFFCIQAIVLGGLWVSRDIINTVILIRMNEDNLDFFLANNKVLTYKKDQLLTLKKRYVTLGGWRFQFQDGRVLKSNNQAMRLLLLKNGMLYTDKELDTFVNDVNAEGEG